MSEEVPYTEWGLHCTGRYGNAHFLFLNFYQFIKYLLTLSIQNAIIKVLRKGLLCEI